MFQFIIWLRALAAVFITNAHYADVWPYSFMAFGGQIGNIMYFFISGFCLYNVKDTFFKWYGKRIIRIYPALWVAATVSILVGDNTVGGLLALIHCYVFPTWYHFIGSIMLLYIVFYIIRTMQKRYDIKTYYFMLFILLLFSVVYCLRFNTKIFHIESIAEKWVLFQFMEAMLIGSLLREQYEKVSEKVSLVSILNVVVPFVLYILLKKVIPSKEILFKFQIVLPFILLWLVWGLANLFVKFEKRNLFEKINRYISHGVSFIASISLEIYLCQYVVIERNVFSFPLSFIIITGGIIIYAWCTHRIVEIVKKAICKKMPI